MFSPILKVVFILGALTHETGQNIFDKEVSNDSFITTQTPLNSWALGNLSSGDAEQSNTHTATESTNSTSHLPTTNADLLTEADTVNNETNTRVYNVANYSLLTVLQAVVIGVIGIIGNSIVITVIGKFSRLREKLTNYLIINQSVIDLMASIFLLLTRGIDNTKALLVENHVIMVLHCYVWRTSLLMWATFAASTFNLIAITVERYLAIVYPITYRNTFSLKKVIAIISLVWLCGLFSNAAALFATRLIGMSCEPGRHWLSPEMKKFYGIARVCWNFFLPFTLMIFCYGRMIHIIRSQVTNVQVKDRNAVTTSSSANSNLREMRMLRAQVNLLQTLVIVCVSFTVCWGPNQLVYFLYNIGVKVDPFSWWFQTTIVLMNINCCVNPIIYTWKYREFQQSLRKLFCGCRDVTDKELQSDTNRDGFSSKMTSISRSSSGTDIKF